MGGRVLRRLRLVPGGGHRTGRGRRGCESGSAIRIIAIHDVGARCIGVVVLLLEMRVGMVLALVGMRMVVIAGTGLLPAGRGTASVVGRLGSPKGLLAVRRISLGISMRLVGIVTLLSIVSALRAASRTSIVIGPGGGVLLVGILGDAQAGWRAGGINGRGGGGIAARAISRGLGGRARG